MTSAINIQSWYDAVCLYEANRIDEAIEQFKDVKQNARMFINIGCCFLRKNNIDSATEVKPTFKIKSCRFFNKLLIKGNQIR